MDQLVNARIQEKFLKEKKWLEDWVIKKVTIQNLKVLKVDPDNNILLVKGAVPGHKVQSLVF